ncbi:MAG: hypothetical protein MI746_12280 [Pseudomonadales bacterium]|nr:hypothetical protein [Pseudomonadales bacterium]
MSAEIAAAVNVVPELIGGGGGVFDVVVDGNTVFSKFSENRFPRQGEIAAILGK